MSNTPNQQAQVVDASKGSDVNVDSSPIIVKEDNFPQAIQIYALPQSSNQQVVSINLWKYQQHQAIQPSNLLFA